VARRIVSHFFRILPWHIQPSRQRRQKQDRTEHIHQEHEGQQQAHVGLVLQGRH